MVAYWCLVRRRGKGYILDDIGFAGIHGTTLSNRGTPEFLTYLTQLLENPERSGTHIFDQQRYTVAAKECLQLCLCSHHNFAKGVIESDRRDRELRRSKPSAWIARMGLLNRSRIWKERCYLQVQLKRIAIYQDHPFPENSLKHEYYRSLAYQWALDLRRNPQSPWNWLKCCVGALSPRWRRNFRGERGWLRRR